jgi:hydrogenase 3 maturation protease
MLEHLKAHIKGKKVVILGIGNTLRSDDGVGSILASRIKDKVPYTVYDAGPSPENYLEKIIKKKPDTIIIIDAADFGGKPGEFNVLEGPEIKTNSLSSTHNASISLTINYLQNNLKVDIMALIIQPKIISFADKLSREIDESLNNLENWFYETAKEKG